MGTGKWGVDTGGRGGDGGVGVVQLCTILFVERNEGATTTGGGGGGETNILFCTFFPVNLFTSNIELHREEDGGEGDCY